MNKKTPKDTCAKCGIEFYYEEHHVLPKCTFNGEGDIVRLCPNCHTEYHKQLGQKNLKNPDMVFHFHKFYTWLYGAGAVLAGLLLWSLFA